MNNENKRSLQAKLDELEAYIEILGDAEGEPGEYNSAAVAEVVSYLKRRALALRKTIGRVCGND